MRTPSKILFFLTWPNTICNNTVQMCSWKHSTTRQQSDSYKVTPVLKQHAMHKK